jgi:ketosteroid isomerase-like protein
VTSEVLELEKLEAAAMLAGDVEALGRIWDDRFTVTPPPQIPTQREEVLARVADGALAYEEFTREVDHLIEASGAVVVTLGSEVVVTRATPSRARELAVRRFTHVWRLDESGWRLVVRHAALVPQP